MQRLSLMGLIIVASILAAANGCFFQKLNDDYCRVNFMALDPEEAEECCDSFPDQCESGGVCTSSNDCTSFETPYCRAATRECVECLESANCTELKPVCDGNKCVECRSHGDCASELCLASGSCAAEGDVAYVNGDTANTIECSRAMPCQNLAQALVVMPKYIKATGAISSQMSTTFDGVTVEIYGAPGTGGTPGTIITRSMNGVVLEMRRAANVTLVDLEVNASLTGDAVELKDPTTMVSMKRVKVRASNGNGVLISDGKLTMTDSELSGSSIAGVSLVKGALVLDGSRVKDNQQDGVKAVAGTVEIRRSSITGNRGTAGVFTTGASLVTIESSVLAANIGMSGGASISGPFTIRNSIISANGQSATSGVGGLTLQPLVATNAKFEFNTVADNDSTAGIGISCTVSFEISNSILTGNTVSGCTNILSSLTTGDPKFLSTNLSAPTFYRIGAMSPARDAAGSSAIADDIDGDPRPVTGKDVGADEYVGP